MSHFIAQTEGTSKSQLNKHKYFIPKHEEKGMGNGLQLQFEALEKKSNGWTD